MNQRSNYFKVFEGNATLVRLVSSVDAPIGASSRYVVQQRLTVIGNGSVSFVSVTKDRDIAESMNFDIDTATAQSVISKIAAFFSKTVDSKRYPTVGNYDLTITNSDGISYFYDGSLNNNYTLDGDNLSSYVRIALNLPQLFVFDDSGMKKELNSLIINSFKDDETIAYDRANGTLTYSKGSNKIHIENTDAISAFMNRYCDKLTSDFNYASSVGDVWDYQVKARFSYGEDLMFGGSYKNSTLPYFWNEMLKETKRIIDNNLSGSLLYRNNVDAVKKSEAPYYCGLALVNLNETSGSTWYRYEDMYLENGDYVIVPNYDGDYIVGKVTRTKEVSETRYFNSYKKIIRKL